MKTHTTSHKTDTQKTTNGTTIYRRAKKGGWTFKKAVDGKVYYFPLGIDVKTAKELADKIRGALMMYPIEKVQELYAQKMLARTKAPPPTLDQTLTILDRIQRVMGWSEGTVRGYKSSLVAVVRKAKGVSRDKVLHLPCSVITPALLADYKDAQLEGLTDQKAIQSRKRTINGNIRDVKAIFSDRTKTHFRNYDMSFVKALREEIYYGGLKKHYKLPKKELITATFDLSERLEGDERTVLKLALHFGLRRMEIFHLRRDWFDLSGDKARLDLEAELDFRPKAGHEGMTIGSKSVAVDILNRALGDDYLLGYRMDDGRLLFERLIAKLRDIGWTKEAGRPSPLHEMRKLFGSYIATSESIYVAQKYLRHADASTTNESYADVIVDKKVLGLWAA